MQNSSGFMESVIGRRIGDWMKWSSWRKAREVYGCHLRWNLLVGTSDCRLPSFCDRTLDTELAQQCHFLHSHMAVIIRKKKRLFTGGLFLFVPQAGVWEHDWSRSLYLGERTSERAEGPNGARGPGSGIGSGLTCFVMWTPGGLEAVIGGERLLQGH